MSFTHRTPLSTARSDNAVLTNEEIGQLICLNDYGSRSEVLDFLATVLDRAIAELEDS